jgi:hypothetical protein
MLNIECYNYRCFENNNGNCKLYADPETHCPDIITKTIALEMAIMDIRKIVTNLQIENDDLTIDLAEKSTNHDIYERWYNKLKSILPDIIGPTRTKQLIDEIEDFNQGE